MSDIIKESDFLFYNGEDGKIHAQVILGNDTVWLSQKTLSEVFGVDRSVVTKHLQNIFSENELVEDSVCAIFAQTATDNKTYDVKFYNLDAVIAVGYRVSSYKATKFRQWATRILNEYLVKGFAMDDERLKQGNRLFGKDYFRELLERIREIRASEKMFYEKVKELFATSADYDKHDPEAKDFFAKVQNKVEYAIVGKTSAEIIRSRADAKQPYMGLKTFKNVNKDGRVQKIDVTVAKNYLTQDELKSLNLLVSAFLDHAEMIISKNIVMKMADWADRLDKFLEFNEYKILHDAGKVRKSLADSFAEKQYAKYKLIQDKVFSEFNNVVGQIKNTGKLPNENDIINSNKVDEPTSEFNKTLLVALKHKPKDTPKNKTRATKPKTKECPVCGKICDKKAQYCDGFVDDENTIPCSHIFKK